MIRFFFILFLFFNTCHADPYFLSPIPKCGHTLLLKCLHLMTDKTFIGVGSASDERVAELIQQSEEENKILKFHYYLPSYPDIMLEREYKNIFIYRDPRDACISLVLHMDKFKGNQRDFFWVPDHWDKMSFNDKLYTVITGKGSLSYLEEWYSRMCNWTKYPKTLCIKFEDIIGSLGGGDDAKQLEVLHGISHYIDLDLSAEKVAEIQSILFEPTSTHRIINGRRFIPAQIGSYKVFFNKKNKKAFKKRFNHLLLKFGYEKNAKW